MTRCTDSREIWHGRGERGSAWPFKISRQSVNGGGNAAPKMAKISTFGKELPTWANPVTDF